jgi:DNA-binding SARP family transcriptional activator/tetratricopeptide (TPR) repeat protein
MSALRLYLFGTLRATRAGEPYRLSMLPRAVPLLALIAARGTARVSRDTLAVALWPDDDEREARTNLRRHLHSLRHAFGDACDPLLVDETHVAWNAEASVWCDVVAFEIERTSKRLETAVALYAGPLLEGHFDEPLLLERETLQTHYLTMCSELLRRARTASEGDAAFELASRIAAVDPWREDILRTLMELRAEGGDRAGALGIYSRFAAALHAEMGVEPMPETQALRAKLAVAREARPAARKASGVQPLRFAGRERERARLEALLSEAARGEGRTAIVCGEAGIGKTRLFAEFAETARRSGARVLRGTVTAGPGAGPYQPFAEALGTDRLRQGDVLATLLAGRGEVAAGEARDRAQVFDALASAFERVAAETPLVFVCEDLHWAGDATLAAFAYLARRCASSPILLLANYRAEEVGPDHAVARLGRELLEETRCELIPLGRLSTADVGFALSDAEPRAELREAAAAQFESTCAGNPFFVAQMLGARLEAGGLLDEGVRAVDLDAVVALRLAALSDAAREFLEFAAVAGDTFDADVVREAAGLDRVPASEAIDELLDRRLIREGGSHIAYRYLFTHHLLRAHTYGTIPERVRERRHRRLGTLLEKLRAGGTATADAELAVHFERSGDRERAARYSFAAAAQALALGAVAEAVELAERGIALATDATLRFDLSSIAERAHGLRGAREAQRSHLAALEELAEDLGDEGRRALAAQRRIDLHRKLGERDLEMRAIERLEAIADRSPDIAVRVRALLERGTSLLLSARFEESRAVLFEARRLSDTSADPAAAVEAACLLADVSHMSGAMLEADELVAWARATAARSGREDLETLVLHSAIRSAVTQQRNESVLQLAPELVRLYDRRGERARLADVYQGLGLAYSRLGRLEDTIAALGRARRLYFELGITRGLAACAITLGEALNSMGRYAEALAQAETAAVIFERLDDLRGQAAAKTNAAVLLTSMDRPARARDIAFEALELARRSGSKVYAAAALAALGGAEREMGAFGDAVRHFQASLEFSREADRRSTLIYTLAELVLALVAAGRIEEAGAAIGELRERERAREEALPEQFIVPYGLAIYACARANAADCTRERERMELQLAEFVGRLTDDGARAALEATPLLREIRAFLAGRRPDAPGVRCGHGSSDLPSPVV